MAGVPNVFGAASAPIPLSQLDANFNTTATLGNAAIGLGNVTTTVGNLTLSNVTIPSISGATANAVVYTNTTGQVTANSSVACIDSSGNVGIGVTPSAWNTSSTYYKGLQIGSNGSLFGLVNTLFGNINLGANIYYDGTDFKFINSAAAARYQQFEDTHRWYTVPTGTAGNTASLTERARITSGGYFKASDNGTYYDVSGSDHEFYQTAAAVNCYFYSSNASLASAIIAPIATRTANSAYSFFRGFSDSGNDTEFLLRGDGNGYADGTFNNNGADYAEFFESANGEALTLGATVVLDGNKVREATNQDSASAIIGVVRPKEPSKASMVVGNTAWNKWANKYLTDDFDRYIMEDHDVVEWEETITDEERKTSTKQHSYESHNIPAGVTVPADAIRKTHDDKGNKFQHYKLNPAWDKDAEYVNRENRPEWNIIGLLGQVKILKGRPVGDRWIKMRDVSATVEEWMIR